MSFKDEACCLWPFKPKLKLSLQLRATQMQDATPLQTIQAVPAKLAFQGDVPCPWSKFISCLRSYIYRCIVGQVSAPGKSGRAGLTPCPKPFFLALQRREK